MLACLLVHSFIRFVEKSERERKKIERQRRIYSFLFFFALLVCIYGNFQLSLGISLSLYYLYERYENLLLEYVFTEELNPITNIGFYRILYYIFFCFLLFCTLHFYIEKKNHLILYTFSYKGIFSFNLISI